MGFDLLGSIKTAAEGSLRPKISGVVNSFNQGVTSLAQSGLSAIGITSSLNNQTSLLTPNSIQSISSTLTPTTQRTKFLVTIVQHNEGNNQGSTVIQAYLPEDLKFSLSSDWKAPFNEGVIDDKNLQTAASLVGVKATAQALTANYWTGSSNLKFSLQLIFYAESSYVDVQEPIRKLIKMERPTKNKYNFLSSPGPSVNLKQSSQALYDTVTSAPSTILKSFTEKPSLDSQPSGLQSISNNLNAATKYDNQITLQIGEFMYFDSVILTSVSHDWKMILDPFGVPMYATVNVEFITHVTPTAEDFDKIFINNPNTQNSTNPFASALSKAIRF